MENRGRKLSEQRRERIRKLLGEGMSVRCVARAMQVAPSTVQRVRKEEERAVVAECETTLGGAESQRDADAASCEEKWLTKRTELSSNVAARSEDGTEESQMFSLRSSFGCRHSSFAAMAFPRLRCGLVLAVRLIQAFQNCLLTKRTRSKLNDAAMIEKPPDCESNFGEVRRWRLRLRTHSLACAAG
ncbi:helix-turn-helix domain-containing protein [Blastopirellula sediminis]|uniref:helix-turn-helix domain-containing protein n=1 Tax=Blastopirellula sediminis TaxID=2894196 RepID=UPI0036F26433